MPHAAVGTRWKKSAILGRLDRLLIFSALAGFNLHLVGLGSPRPLIFYPDPVLDGQWWRLLTHPFVHVSFYHLILDAGAFWILYRSIDHRTPIAKAACASVCAAFGLAAAWLSTAPIETLGLCGLSSTAHGLMALTALQQIDRGAKTGFAVFSLLLVVCKSTVEAVSGEVFFVFLHMGLCGSPLAACHLGGVCGGVLAFLTGKRLTRIPGSIRDSNRWLRLRSGPQGTNGCSCPEPGGRRLAALRAASGSSEHKSA